MPGGSARAQELNFFVILGHPHGAAGFEVERWPQPHHHFYPICTVMNMVALVGCMCLRTSSMASWSTIMTDKIALLHGLHSEDVAISAVKDGTAKRLSGSLLSTCCRHRGLPS